MRYNRAIIKIHYGCNNRCLFCHSHGLRHRQGSLDRIQRKIRAALDLGIDQVLLSGGEPTIYTGIERVLAQLKAARMSSGFISNGRRFAYPDFTRQALSAGARFFYISLHSHKAHVHDTLTAAPGSWAQTLAGIRNLVHMAPAASLTVNCVVTRANLDRLPEMAAFCKANGIGHLKFSFPEPKGLTLANRDVLLECMPQAARQVSQAMDAGESVGLKCSYDGLPYCRMPARHRMKLDNLESNRIFFMSEAFEEEFFRCDESDRTQRAACHHCAYFEVCPGIYKGYPRERETPVREPVPNMFHLYRIGIGAAKAGKCLRDAAPDFCHLPFKRICVQRGKDLDLYEAWDPFFRIANFLRAREMGQLYLPRADQGSCLPFRKDSFFGLSRLARLPMCAGCRESCPGIYVAGEKVEVGKAIQRRLMALKGRVLDIGFGELVLAGVLLEGLKGRIRYTGIDPDKGACTLAAARYPEAKFLHTCLEAFDGEAGGFDAVLMLGSFAHLKDPVRALARVKKLLRAGGRLMVVENEVFGVLSDQPYPEEFQATATPGSAFEHYGNPGADTLSRLLTGTGFSIARRLDATSAGSHFWYLEAVTKI